MFVLITTAAAMEVVLHQMYQKLVKTASFRVVNALHHVLKHGNKVKKYLGMAPDERFVYFAQAFVTQSPEKLYNSWSLKRTVLI